MDPSKGCDPFLLLRVEFKVVLSGSGRTFHQDMNYGNLFNIQHHQRKKSTLLFNSVYAMLGIFLWKSLFISFIIYSSVRQINVHHAHGIDFDHCSLFFGASQSSLLHYVCPKMAPLEFFILFLYILEMLDYTNYCA